MNTKISCALWLLLSASALAAQPAPTVAYDTIYVSDQMTTYMIFPENVAIMDLGSRNYLGKIESGNMLYLKPLKANVAPSSLLVRTAGERIYLHYIAYRQQPRKIFWDYRPDSLRSGFPQGGNEKAVSQSNSDYLRQLENLKKGKKKRLGSYRANGLVLGISNLAVDRQVMYLLLGVKNNTSIPYGLEYVSFAYKERRSRKSHRRIEPQENVVEPLAQVAASAIPPHGEESLGYALPLHAGTNRGFLEVVVREKGGDRSLRVRLAAGKIARARYLSAPKDSPVHPLTVKESHVSQTNPR